MSIFRFWLPLYASWLLMTLEGPFMTAVINRLPDEVVMLAAMGIVYSLAVTVEAPIINLLATATALVEDRESWSVVRRFTIRSALVLTGVMVLLWATPCFDLVVRRLLAVPADVADAVRPGLAAMTLFPGAIAWRRCLQGVMIRHGDTHRIAAGTTARLVVSAGTALLLWVSGDVSGVLVGAGAVQAGVLAEMVWIHVAARRSVAAVLARTDVGPAAERLTTGRLVTYHWPLALTTILTLLAQPLVTFALARLPEPRAALAAWPLVFQATLALRAAGLSIPEVVIALERDAESRARLTRFVVRVAAAISAAMVLFLTTPLVDAYLLGVQDATQELAEMTRRGLLVLAPLPGLAVLTNWLRGRFMRARLTRVVRSGMVVHLGVLAGTLTVGLAFEAPGIVTASAAMVVAVLAELVFLARRRGEIPALVERRD